jgi:hypothetical protein
VSPLKKLPLEKTDLPEKVDYKKPILFVNQVAKVGKEDC